MTLSGSRVALAAAVLAVAAIAAVHRERETSIRVAAAAIALAAGVAIDRLLGAASNSVDRLGSASGAGRSTVWRYGMEAFLDRPLLGFGPGRFRAAVQGRFSAAFVAEHAADDVSQPWFDAHNVVINLLVSVGVIGTVLLLVWVALWARGARGPLVWLLVVLALTWMVQPISLFTMPLACLLFGTAGAGETASLAAITLPRRVVAPVAAIGVFLGAWLLVADVRLQRAADDLDPASAGAAARMYLGDPVAADVVAQITQFAGGSDIASADELRWRRRSTEREPDRPYWWARLAVRELQSGLPDDALRSITEADSLQRYNQRTLRISASIAVDRRDEAMLAEVLERMCEMDMPECGQDASEILRRTAGG